MMQPEPINGDIWACKDASRERVQLQIKNIFDIRSEGAFSQMFSALMTREEEEAPTKVALKEIEVPRMRRRDPNSQYNAFYEVFLLRRLATRYPHKRIVELLYTRRCDGGKNERGEPIHLYKLIFLFMPSNLKEQREILSKECNLLDIKLYMWQLFSGLDHLRKVRILHRDVKPGNLLVDPDTGQLKIADFGCAVRLRHYYSNFNLPTYAITRPYRPPELLLGSSVYDLMADVWSSGIVFIELFLGRTLFQTPQAWTDEQKRAMRHQVIQMIFKLLGPPSKDELRGMGVKDDVNIVVEPSADRLTMQGLKLELMGIGFRDAQIPIDLFARILQYVPSRRLHGRDLLGDPFFAELFEDEKMRKNGKRISLSIDPTLDLRSIWGTKC